MITPAAGVFQQVLWEDIKSGVVALICLRTDGGAHESSDDGDDARMCERHVMFMFLLIAH